MAAQAAVGFIKQGCSMLHEGRMELEGAKKTAEQVIGDVKAIKGIFDWFIGLFTSKPTEPNAPSKPVAQKKAAAKKAAAKAPKEVNPELAAELAAELGVDLEALKASRAESVAPQQVITPAVDEAAKLLTITFCVAVAVLPFESVTVHVTVVVPIGNVVGASLVTVATEQLSAVAGIPKSIPVPEQEVIVAGAAVNAEALTEAGLKNANN